MLLQKLLQQNPIIAILRGLTLVEVNVVGDLIYDAGIRVIEVPLNRPGAFDAIRALLNHLPADCLIGAGTVLDREQVNRLNDIGAKIIISPNISRAVVTAALQHNMHVMPGIATATEAFNAHHAGARWLKLFPASSYGINHLKALKTVLPHDTHLIAVGGINANNIRHWLEAGAAGVGIGSDLYMQGDSGQQVKQKLSLFGL
jgi:2-dehydro-3-deoxyphosphogalactonate aldolase